MTKTTHTHRGTCQACGRVQAVDNNSRLIAKHGYTVDWGYFNGVCKGAGAKPAETDITLTTQIQTFCLDEAAKHTAAQRALEDGTMVPDTFNRWNPNKERVRRTRYGIHKSKGDYEALPIAQATEEERRKAIIGAARDHELKALNLRDHEQMLRLHVVPRHGKILYTTEELNVKVEKPAAPVVDVKTATVSGTFPTKAARQEALDRLNRAYEKAHNELQALFLALPHEQRTKAKTEVYWGPQQLNHWRPKHAEAALREFPQAADIVTRINELVKVREAVKAAS